ncbi:MAG TPA: family 1 glycosylhydrolase [Verrucomicrobiae bacterium]|nr:family 1 glycosylhydrolase [Verrucomicrobiae bacterium]
MALTKSQASSLTEATAFLWATGVEDTFITDPWPQTGRTLDEYELTEHYQRWHSDLGLMASLGVRTARYGIPWHKINPARGVWDWSWADQTLEHLLTLRIDPIIDLVHYGLPRWIEGAYLNPQFSELMAEYARRMAERFRGRIHLYTPLNEPRVTAWYCGKLGWWPPNRRGWRGFVELMLAICRGIVLTVEALECVDEEILPVHVDATDLYETSDMSLQIEADRRQEIVFLALDLMSGRIDETHSLRSWLLRQGASNADLDWFLEHKIELQLIGINLYPMFSRKILSRPGGRMRIRMPYATADIVERLGKLYWQRYRVPIFIAETASVGSVARRRQWLDESVAAVKRLRDNGVPLIGYTWWPLFALVTWAYRQGTHPPGFYLKQMGLWDLDPDLNRVETELAEEYRRLVAGGCERAGQLACVQEERMAHVS